MSKLFFILYLSGQVAAVFGPVSYSLHQCLIWAEARMETTRVRYALGSKAVFNDGTVLELEDIHFACEYYGTSPKVEIEYP